MDDKKKSLLIALIGKKKPTEEPEMDQTEGDDIVELSGDLLTAISNEDPEEVGHALKAIVELCLNERE